ncbi:NAD-dependent epimerase/dehydratase family protein [Candidatus Woesearchaeota archaeon]|nr:NAD-dependent epimerase/dehydratase family protein [Candidatus Woesearchaeota archaeon]
MRCVVTGGAGFIGSNLALHLENEGEEVVIVDNFKTGKEENLAGFRGEIIKADVSGKFDVNGKVDVIFHQAAITDPRHENDDETIRDNLSGFRNILSMAMDKKAKLIYASSASMYGNGPAPQKEDQEKELFTAYSKSKLMIDNLAKEYLRKIHIVGLRYFNVFGPREKYKGRAASMIYHLARQMKSGKNPRIFKMGEQRRDHIYVKDCVTANIKAINGEPGVYNVGTGICTSFNDLIAMINKSLGTNLKPEYIDNPYEKTYQKNTQADTSKTEKHLGFKARYGLQKAINEYVVEL